MSLDLQTMVNNQIGRVLRRGSRMERFDQLRSRHFWSSYLFLSDPTANIIPAGQYDIFKVVPGGVGQGYPTNVPLTLRETNWLNGGRVPDNQNFVITEIGATVKRPPAVDTAGASSAPANAPTNGIWANLSSAQQAHINNGSQQLEVPAADTQAILYGIVLEMSFLTNNVPLGLLADFSQSAGSYVPYSDVQSSVSGFDGFGDMLNGVPAAAFRRKLEVPIMLQHGENMGMRLNVPRNINVTPTSTGGKTPSVQGCGWFEVRIDWWAHESFVEKS